jgi:hypothetical protein
MACGETPFEKSVAKNAIGFFGLHIHNRRFYDGEVYFAAHNGKKTIKRSYYDQSSQEMPIFIIV